MSLVVLAEMARSVRGGEEDEGGGEKGEGEEVEMLWEEDEIMVLVVCGEAEGVIWGWVDAGGWKESSQGVKFEGERVT